MHPTTSTSATPTRRGTVLQRPAVRAGAAAGLAVVLLVGAAWAKSADGPANRRSNPQPASRPAAKMTPSNVKVERRPADDADAAQAVFKVEGTSADRTPASPEPRDRADSSDDLLHDATLSADESPAASPPAPRRVRPLRMQVTAYCPCSRCCGPDAKGLTASGRPVSHDGGAFVAADTSVLPFGTKLEIPGYHGGRPVEVIDRGGAIRGHRLDVYFPTHRAALEWGRQWVTVNVVE